MKLSLSKLGGLVSGDRGDCLTHILSLIIVLLLFYFLIKNCFYNVEQNN